MKKYLTILVAVLLMNTHLPAQDRDAAINHYWINYAEDTSLTYGQIVHICDSLFAHSGFSDTLQWKTDTADENGIEEGGGYVKYLRWRSFWLQLVEASASSSYMQVSACVTRKFPVFCST